MRGPQENLEVPNTSPDVALDVTDVIGGYGPWQRNVFLLLFLASIPSTWHNLMITFIAPPGVDFWCARPMGIRDRVSVEKWRNLTAPSNSGWDNCRMVTHWDNSSDDHHSVVKCRSWEYNTTAYTATIIDQWNLVCDREWLVSLSKSIFNIGYLFGVFVFGILSDRLGRRPTLLMSYTINVSAGILSAFSTSFEMFCALRFLTAVGAAAFYTISFVILVEMVSPEHRPTIGMCINFGWSLAFISLPAVAWLVREWYWLQLAVTLPKLLFLPIFCLLPESPRWLLTKKKNEEFSKLVLKASAKNGRPEKWVKSQIDTILLENQKYTKVDESASVWDIFREPGLRMHAINLFYNWVVNSFIYFGLSYNTEELAGNIYLNFFASGAVEFPSYVLAIYVMKRMGRRIPMVIGMVAGGVACALTIAIPDYGWFFTLQMVVSLLGKLLVTATFSTTYLYSSEIFPTVLRNVGVSTGSTFARIGSVLAPFVRELDNATSPSVSRAIFASLSISSGLLVLYLPETHNMKFVDTLKDAAELSRYMKEGNRWGKQFDADEYKNFKTKNSCFANTEDSPSNSSTTL